MTRFKLRYMPFPKSMRGIRGLTSGAGANPLIVIDANLSDEEKTRTLKHELAHLELDHMNSNRDLKELEAEADARAAAMTDQEFEALMKWEILRETEKTPSCAQ